jgi:hypothetical protein
MPESDIITIPWKPIEPLPSSLAVNGSLGALEALRTEWQRRLAGLSESERVRVRQRSLRRLSVETGILERLYELDWGLTLTLVAEGFTRDVVEREGGRVDERTLATLRGQMDSLAMVLDFVRQDRPLTNGFIKELHHAITRTQDTYTATDSLGRVFERALPKGVWKSDPNHVLRHDNTLLEYAPPEQTASEMDRLIALWTELDADAAVHALLKAAWLHHRFVQIHPFADGNGRVARALTLLVLEKHRYAPLVIDRWHRADYLRALDTANAGDLLGLLKLFIKLESAALASELERPEEERPGGLALDVAHTLADQLAAAKRRRQSDIQRRLETLAISIAGRIQTWAETKRRELADVFRARSLPDVDTFVGLALPPSERIGWFRRQIIVSAHTAGHYANFQLFSAWCSLRLRLESWQLRYVASIHGAGREPGVMAVTTFAEIAPWAGRSRARAGETAFITTTKDAFRFVHTETTEELNHRAGELEELLEEGLTEALTHLLKRS